MDLIVVHHKLTDYSHSRIEHFGGIFKGSDFRCTALYRGIYHDKTYELFGKIPIFYRRKNHKNGRNVEAIRREITLSFLENKFTNTKYFRHII